MKRRAFFKTSFLSAYAAAFVPCSVFGRNGNVPPSDRIYVGAIGTGGRFLRALLPSFYQQDDVRIVAVCDCWKERREEAKANVDMRYENEDCIAYRFHEEILERDDIDAVILATGDRWHAVLSALAAKAGKDVYSEKPYCLTIAEGRQLVEVAKQQNIIWQCGTQRHSNPDYLYVIDVVRQGKIGKLHTISTKLGSWGGNGEAKPEAIPEGFDYDRWLGQSPWRRYSPVSVDLWRNHWDTGGGVIADMGPHMYDIAQMATQSGEAIPIHYQGTAVFPQSGFSNVPFEWDVRAKYENGVQLLTKMGEKSIRFIGDEGWIEIVDATGEIRSEPQSLSAQSAPTPFHYNRMGEHVRDFLDGMRSRRLPVCHPEIAHRAHTIVHASNICLRLGRAVNWDYRRECFVDDDDANRMLSRPMRAPWEI